MDIILNLDQNGYLNFYSEFTKIYHDVDLDCYDGIYGTFRDFGKMIIALSDLNEKYSNLRVIKKTL